ncbi:phosphatidylglycerophosphatase [Orbus hercynius]|uniref:undecaprenyl-diphosphate phosphatase n=1 Tax=Orbus hercynius TaxID=593135 RepID=A0A495RK70_9GAMM|nr:phosphatidylglycerophosphatase B [Orbus hercynius]RKS87714.1 phosphatidylglycerophosphatase [Orbus hercynius]
MLSIIKKTLITLAIFLITPITIIAINWQWQPETLNSTSKYLFWITETAGVPWALLSCVFFALLFALCLKLKSPKQLAKLLIILVVAMLLGQAIKSVVKTYTADSRPFVLWIESKYNVDDEYFYSLSRSDRREILKQYIAHSPEIPKWLYQHWRSETGYTFPSGHALFAATWAFLALTLLNFKRYQTIICIIIAWAVLIEMSRIVLGMHRPIDVIVGSIIAWFIAMLSYYLAKRWQLIKE